MKTFVTISGGILLALSCAAPSDARMHANREGQTQSEPSNYNPEYQDSQTSTWNLDNSCLHCGATTGLAQTLPSYESNGFPITLHQAQVLMGLADIQEQLPDPSFARSRMRCSPHLWAALKARNHLVAKLILAKLSSRGYVGGG